METTSYENTEMIYVRRDIYDRLTETKQDVILALRITKIRDEIRQLDAQITICVPYSNHHEKLMAKKRYFIKMLSYYEQFKKKYAPALLEEPKRAALISQQQRIADETRSKYQYMIEKEIAEKTADVQKQLHELELQRQSRINHLVCRECFHLDIDGEYFKSFLCPICGVQMQNVN